MRTWNTPTGQSAAALHRRGTRFGDAARVHFSHFRDSFFGRDGSPPILGVIGLIASPTFVLISGLVVGFMWRSRPQDFGRLRITLIDRGLFLLTVAHVAMWPAFLATGQTRRLFVTDAIGVFMIFGPWIVSVMRPRTTLMLSVALYVAAWLGVVGWHPDSALLTVVKEAFGNVRLTSLANTFPLLMWFVVFLAGTLLGRRVGDLHVQGEAAAIMRLLAFAGLAATTVAVGLHLAGAYLVPDMGMDPSSAWMWDRLTARIQKVPPGPVYLLFNGGAGLMMILGWYAAERKSLFQRAARFTATIGRVSLIVFVTQFYVYYTLLSVQPVLPR